MSTMSISCHHSSVNRSGRRPYVNVFNIEKKEEKKKKEKKEEGSLVNNSSLESADAYTPLSLF